MPRGQDKVSRLQALPRLGIALDRLGLAGEPGARILVG